ncbi:MAG: hypothetical protein AAGA57_00460 [Planctomycetota bacterium]
MDDWLNEAAELTPWIPLAGLAVAVVVGLWTWVFGARLVKSTMVVCGLALGAVAGAAAGSVVAADSSVFLTIMGLGGAVGGLLVSLLLFRLWVGLAAGIVAAAVCPAVVLAWDGPQPEDPAAPESAEVAEAKPESASPGPSRAAMADARGEGQDNSGAPDTPEAPEGEGASLAQGFVDGDLAEGLVDALPDALPEGLPTDTDAAVAKAQEAAAQVWDTLLQSNLDVVWTWWDGVTAQTQRGVYLGAAIAGVIGLGAGLLMPKTVAGLLASAVGGSMVYFAGRELVVRQWPDVASQWPSSPRATVVFLGLITLLGVLVQWATRKRKADDRK